LQLQGSGYVELEDSTNIFVFEDKVRSFNCKINLSIDKTQVKYYSVFLTQRILIDAEHYKCFIRDIQINVLLSLYFSRKNARIINRTSERQQLEYDTNLEQFWYNKAMGYTNIRKTVLCFLMDFQPHIYASKDFLHYQLYKINNETV